jgi:predicted flavoprotein YhiN
VLITSGGQSYPGCGTTGDGYLWAQRLGHTIVPPRPALTPVTVEAGWLRELQGITIPDVSVCVVSPLVGQASGLPGDSPALKTAGRRPTPRSQGAPAGNPGRGGVLAESRGSFLFTHFGLSGPTVLNVSRAISGHPQPAELRLECDFRGKKQARAVFADQLPHRLLDAILQQVGVRPDQRLAELSKAARLRWIDALKRLALSPSGTLGFKKAEVTAGGVQLAEIDSSTMQSKLVPNLYFAGEVLDLDGPIGGYNFQAAFSTGWLAAEHVV